MVSGSLTMSHSEIDGMNRTDECIAFDNFTLNAVDIHGCVDGIKLGSNDVIKASYVHSLARGAATHNDAIQTQGGSNDVIQDNTLMAYDAATNDPMNAAIQTGRMLEDLRNVIVRHNYMDGGNYTINAGGGSGADGYAKSNYVFSGNVFGHHARYGVIQGLGAGISFDATNVWVDTGLAVQ
jgi:hypothetical protein